MLRGNTVGSWKNGLKQRPLAKNLPDGTGKSPDVRGKGDRHVRGSGLRQLEVKKDLREEPALFMWVERLSKAAKNEFLLSKNNLLTADAVPPGNEYAGRYAI